MNLWIRVVLFGASFLVSLSSLAASSLAEVKQLWQENKSKPGYAEYQAEFIQYNNSLHLDTKDGCFDRDSRPITMYLVITAQAAVESVVTDVDNPKAQCFKHTYTGLRVKAPPFSPLVIQMNMKNN